MQDAFTRFSVLKHTGAVKEKKSMEGTSAERLVETIINGRVNVFGAPRIIM